MKKTEFQPGHTFGIYTLIREVPSPCESDGRYVEVSCPDGQIHVRALYSIVRWHKDYCGACHRGRGVTEHLTRKHIIKKARRASWVEAVLKRRIYREWEVLSVVNVARKIFRCRHQCGHEQDVWHRTLASPYGKPRCGNCWEPSEPQINWNPYA